MNESLREAVDSAPRKTGVYLFKDESGRILYVGKAADLRSRLKNYLNPQDVKTGRLVESAETVETVLTQTESEALILEDALVKQNQPRYNVRLRDDKRYPYIRVAAADDYPWIEVARRIKTDGSRYFGPYPDGAAVKKIINLVAELFGVRTCTYDLNRLERPCIKHSMGKCCAPNLVTGKKEYAERTSQATSFLAGKHKRVKKKLLKQIREASGRRDFELAGRLKKTLESIESLTKTQDVSGEGLPDMDVLGYGYHEGQANIAEFKVRGHKVVAVMHHPLKGEYRNECPKAVKSFIKQHYVSGDVTPKLIVTSCQPEDHDSLERYLSDLKGGKVKLHYARRGQKRKLAELAVENSIHQIKQELLKGDVVDRLELLKKIFRLPKKPVRIEGFDISNLGDRQVVGGMVAYTDGRPDKKWYRRFKIRRRGQSDVDAISEMVKRRFNHPEWGKPDLVLLDGGKPQLNACLNHIPDDVSVVALAKKQEEAYVPGASRPVRLEKDNPALLLLSQIRDETHRFAKNYHKKRRGTEFIDD